MSEQLCGMGVMAWLANHVPEMHRCVRSVQHFFIFSLRAVKHFCECPRSVVGLRGQAPLPKRDVFRRGFVGHESMPREMWNCLGVLDSPPLAILATQKRVGLRHIGDAHVRRVVLDPAARAKRYDAQQHDLRQSCGIRER